MSRTRRIVAGGAAAIGIALGAAAIAGAVTGQTTPTEVDADDTQEPQLNGSVQVPDDESMSEADEASQLEPLAGVTADDAMAAATAAVPGTAGDAELENENGSVVYEVPVTADDGTVTEVKVDAGNGDVLATETDDEENEADEADDEDDDEDETDDDNGTDDNDAESQTPGQG